MVDAHGEQGTSQREVPASAGTPARVARLDNSGIDAGVVKLYDFQEELAAPGLAGRNCIICAPTGSGKTIVAVKIALVFSNILFHKSYLCWLMTELGIYP